MSIRPDRTAGNLKGLFLAAVAGVVLSSELAGATLYTWDASSGLFPDQVTPVGGSIVLQDNSSQNVALNTGLGALTFPGDTILNSTLFYRLNLGDGGLSAPSNPLQNGYVLHFNFRVDSSIQTDDRRGAVSVTMRTGQSRYSMTVGVDYVRLIRDFETGSPLATVDTNDAFHAYRLEVDGVAPGSAIRLFQDGSLVLTASTGILDPGESSDIAFSFGESSGIARGTTQWRSFSVVAVPEPSSALFLGLAALSSILLARRRC
jgi:hypothetical protein